MTEFLVNGTFSIALESERPKMDKPLKHHITELEYRIQHLSQEMMQNQKTQKERNRIEAELRVAQQAFGSLQKSL